MRPMRTSLCGESVIRLAPPWFRVIKVDRGRGYAPAWCSKFALKITDKVLYLRRESYF